MEITPCYDQMRKHVEAEKIYLDEDGEVVVGFDSFLNGSWFTHCPSCGEHIRLA